MKRFSSIIKKYNSTSLILRIVIGLVIGTLLGVLVPQLTGIALLGTLFVYIQFNSYKDA